MCDKTHICQQCKKETKCVTYTWACPWINDDEIQMCEECEKIFSEEYAKSWHEEGKNK